MTGHAPLPAWPQSIRDADLRSHNTLGIAARAAALTCLTSAEQIPALLEAAASFDQPSPLLLGDGSNVLLLEDYPGLVVINQIGGRQRIEQDGEHAWVEVGAGENWDELVDWSIDQGWSGLENLALIPGRAGAAPIQNIGAYGVEFESVCAAVQIFDCERGNSHWLDREDCEFGYRDSIFKRSGRDWWVTAIRLRLNRQPLTRHDYAGLRGELERLGLDPAKPADVAAAVRSLRRSKLPDPARIGNAGSFFKNPVVALEQAEHIRQELPALPQFPAGDGQVKLSAAYLIDQAGWKGRRYGDAGVHADHALVLVNHGQASGHDLYQLASEIAADIQARWQVTLEIEPRVIGTDGTV